MKKRKGERETMRRGLKKKSESRRSLRLQLLYSLPRCNRNKTSWESLKTTSVKTSKTSRPKNTWKISANRGHRVTPVRTITAPRQISNTPKMSKTTAMLWWKSCRILRTNSKINRISLLQPCTRMTLLLRRRRIRISSNRTVLILLLVRKLRVKTN